MPHQTAADRRRKRAAIIKARRASGKSKPVISKELEKKRSEVKRLKSEKEAMRNKLKKEKDETKNKIKAAKKKIDDERRQKAKLEKLLRQKLAQENKIDKSREKEKVCNDSYFLALHNTMVSTVPGLADIKSLTHKEFNERRKHSDSAWTALRKYMVKCHKAKFYSQKATRSKNSKSSKTSGSNRSAMPTFQNRPVYLPDIGVEIDEDHYKKVTAQAFKTPKTPASNKKKKKISPVFVSGLVS
ncbi:FirrV-1-F4 [Feldmannia irregularis virus a]|uniref:FirrV-1-F4 n=1 Tax=Feldmannia irregularis virus a TaxID=231992 RepID=Q6XLV3_9PHYC|nr:FirrV-1-F4 [Feldmannia irregularis virus a]AAR26958.1 FirrV-1-F4 [Feldmannia irregularis virus a]